MSTAEQPEFLDDGASALAVWLAAEGGDVPTCVLPPECGAVVEMVRGKGPEAVRDWIYQAADKDSSLVNALLIATPTPAVPASGLCLSQDDADATAWPPITAIELSPSPPFPAHVFPEAVRRYCLEVAHAMRVPVDFVAVVIGCGKFSWRDL